MVQTLSAAELVVYLETLQPGFFGIFLLLKFEAVVQPLTFQPLRDISAYNQGVIVCLDRIHNLICIKVLVTQLIIRAPNQ